MSETLKMRCLRHYGKVPLELVVFQELSHVNRINFHLFQNRFIFKTKKLKQEDKKVMHRRFQPLAKAHPKQVNLWECQRATKPAPDFSSKTSTQVKHSIVFSWLWKRALRTRSHWSTLKSTDTSLNPPVKIITSATGLLRLGMHVKSSSQSGIKENSHPKHC